MTKKEFSISSSDKVHKINCIEWIPKSDPVAVLQITHGMAEHMERYNDFANAALEKGFLVIGHDHLGHGKSAEREEELGFFHEKDGSKILVADLHRVTAYIKNRYPGLPVFLLGHSMGSFITRKYLTVYGGELSGTVLVGTGYQPLFKVTSAWLLAAAQERTMGGFYRSPALHKLVLEGNNKAFEPAKTEQDWLCRDEEVVDGYRKDPLCGFQFTVSAYRDFFSILTDLAMQKGFAHIPKELPVLLVSGAEDPVGGFSKGVYKVYRELRKIGLKDVQVRLYEKGRHEILNELNKEEVYLDIFEWIHSVIKN